MNLLLDYKAVRERLLSMTEITDGIRDALNSMQETVENLDLFWDSEAGNEYIIRFEADFYTANVLLQRIKAGAEILYNALYKGQLNEKAVEQIIEGM